MPISEGIVPIRLQSGAIKVSILTRFTIFEKTYDWENLLFPSIGDMPLGTLRLFKYFRF